MVTTFTTPDSQEAPCPSCGATFKVPGRRRRVQCPKCREVVTIEFAAKPPASPPKSPAPGPPKPAPPVAAPPDEEPGARPARIEALELRIAALEGRLKQPPIAPRPPVPVPVPVPESPEAVPPLARPAPAPAPGAAPPPATAPAGLWWVTGDDAQLLDLTPTQEAALLHNLGALAGQTITLRTISGNTFARKRADALKAIFERAGWVVRGVEEIPRTHAEPGITLAVGTLPVEKEAATTFLALKAAGLPVIPVLDPSLATLTDDEPPRLSLTVAPGRAV